MIVLGMLELEGTLEGTARLILSFCGQETEVQTH